MARRPRLLFLSHVLPFPPDSGVAMRTYHTLRELAQLFEVHSLCFFRHSAQENRGSVEDSLRALRELGPAEAFPIPQEYSRSRYLMDHARSLMVARPYTWYAYDSRQYAASLRNALRDGFDFVHVESLDLVRYLPALDPARTLCVHHNIESKLMARRAEAERVVGAKAYLKRQATLLERTERAWAPTVSANVVVSPRDEDDLQQIAPGSSTIVVPNGVDVDEFKPGGPGNGDICYIGGTEWHPNLDALEYFANEILPRIRATGAAPRVFWVGRSSAAEREAFRRSHDIELTGYVERVQDWGQHSSCVVVPLRVGGGTRLKITTAWAMGRAVVSTSVGCEGLNAVDGENILIRDDPAGFAEAVARVLRDRDLRDRLGRQGRRTAERTYSWKVSMRPLLSWYAQQLQ